MNNIEKVQESLNNYNITLDNICNDIQKLKVNCNPTELKIQELWVMLDKLSVINSLKSRKLSEKLLQKLILELGYHYETHTR